MATDVFISYSPKDSAYAETLCQGLEKRGLKCWIAPRDVPANASFAAGVLDGLNQSRVFLLIFSSSSNHSEYIARQVKLAAGKSMICLRIEDVQPQPPLDLSLPALQILDVFTLQPEEILDKLFSLIGREIQPRSGFSTPSTNGNPSLPTIAENLARELGLDLSPGKSHRRSMTEPLAPDQDSLAEGLGDLLSHLGHQESLHPSDRRILREPPTPPPAAYQAPSERPQNQPVSTPASVAQPQSIERTDPSSSWQKNRYGRVEYFSPMEMNKEYSLRVALLLERHAKNVSQEARVRFASLNIPFNQEEPLIKIIPYSSHLKISPPSREVILHKSKEPVADFLILIDHLPENPTNEFDLQIDFEIQGELITRIPIKITAQRQFCLGRIHFSHSYWRLFGIFGSIFVALGTGADLITTASVESIGMPFRIIIFILAFLFLGFAVWLFSRAAKRRKMILNRLVH
jgi:hypothetical protein